jgi:hypothetical protein
MNIQRITAAVAAMVVLLLATPIGSLAQPQCTTCTPSTRAAKQAIASTPIVMAAVADPVVQKLIASLAMPGANMMEMFTSILSKPATIAVLLEARSDVHPRMWQALGPIAEALNAKLVGIVVSAPAAVNLPIAPALGIASRRRHNPIEVRTPRDRRGAGEGASHLYAIGCFG